MEKDKTKVMKFIFRKEGREKKVEGLCSSHSSITKLLSARINSHIINRVKRLDFHC